MVNVLAICLKEIPSAKVGVNSILNELSEQQKISFVFKESLNVSEEDVALADIVISIRGCEDVEKEIIKESKRLGKYVIYFLDDDLLNIPESSNSFLYFDAPRIKENMNEIMSLSDCLWTTSINIEKKYKDYFKEKIILDAPALLLTEKTDDFKEAAGSHENSSEIVIGFAGSIDHASFLDSFLQTIISKILEKYPQNVRFEFFGAKPDFLESEDLNISHIPYVHDHEEYKKQIKTLRWNIGLAPLPDTFFHSCKYFNKYLEYGALGIAGVYSDLEPYRFIIKDMENGVLTKNTEEAWVEAISKLIEEESARTKIIENSKKELEERFTTKAIAEQLVQVLPNLLRYQAPSCSVKEVQLSNRPRNIYFHKVTELFKNYGLRAIPIMSKKAFNKIKNRQ